MIPELSNLRDDLYSPMSSIVTSHQVIYDMVVENTVVPKRKFIQRIRGIFQHMDFILVREGYFHLLDGYKGFIYIIIPNDKFMWGCKYFKESSPRYYMWAFNQGVRYVLDNNGNYTGFNDYDDAVLSLMSGGQLYDVCDYSWFKSVGYDIREVPYVR